MSAARARLVIGPRPWLFQTVGLPLSLRPSFCWSWHALSRVSRIGNLPQSRSDQLGLLATRHGPTGLARAGQSSQAGTPSVFPREQSPDPINANRITEVSDTKQVVMCAQGTRLFSKWGREHCKCLPLNQPRYSLMRTARNCLFFPPPLLYAPFPLLPSSSLPFKISFFNACCSRHLLLHSQNLGRTQRGDSFASHGICCDRSVVFASNLARLEGQGGPCLVPRQERPQGWVPSAALLQGHLRASPHNGGRGWGGWADFFHGGSKHEYSKAQAKGTQSPPRFKGHSGLNI